MTTPVQIENLPEEVGEETTITTHDDGTISSAVVGSTAGKEAAPKMGEVTEDATPEEASEEEESTEEREFDKNPTVLYALVQKKLWKEAIARAKSNPKEARAFISRKEKDGSIRWRLLPLHAAIVFKAPESVIEALLTSYSKASEEKDDQGMLPLHLAFRNGASVEVVNSLLMAFPASVDSPDRKGRVPLTLAEAAESPLKELYIEALEKGPSHYAIVAMAAARERIVAEQQAKFDEKMKETLEKHEAAIAEAVAESEEKSKEIQEAVVEKELELTKLHENSQVLVEHVASLEAQMNTRTDTERFLATKIAKLEAKVRKGEAHLQERETFWEKSVADVDGELQKTKGLQDEDKSQYSVEKTKLTATIEGLAGELAKTKAKLSLTETQLADSLDKMKDTQDEWDMKEIRYDTKHAKVEIDWANSQANVAILESQLKKRMENEHLLASQVSNLASRLAESADSNMKFSMELKQMETSKTTLETTVEVLKKKLENVTDVMESTRTQQMSILDDAIAQEETMAKCMESHAQMVSASIDQEKDLQAAKNEMMALIEKRFEDANEKRLMRLSITTGHGQSLSNMNASRQSVLSCAQTVSTNVMGALQNDLDLSNLDVEVRQAEVAKRRRIPSKAVIDADEVADEVAEEVADEVADEVHEEPAEETPTEEETPAETVEEPAAEETSEEETSEVVVVSSPKVFTPVVADTEEPQADEARTEVEIAPEEVQADRVTAE